MSVSRKATIILEDNSNGYYVEIEFATCLNEVKILEDNKKKIFIYIDPDTTGRNMDKEPYFKIYDKARNKAKNVGRIYLTKPEYTIPHKTSGVKNNDYKLNSGEVDDLITALKTTVEDKTYGEITLYDKICLAADNQFGSKLFHNSPITPDAYNKLKDYKANKVK